MASPTMRLYKSTKARDVLMSQNLALSQAERRVLILCDGQRTRTAIEKMLGDAASTTIDILIDQGYLQTSSHASTTAVTETKPVLAGLSSIGKKILRSADVSDASSNASPPSLPPTSTATSPTNLRPDVRRESRRSMAACKMYMLDMLQLQRSIESSALAVDIQTATNEEALIDALFQALHHLCTTTKASMGERIAQRLLETMPEAHVPRLEDAVSTLFDKVPAHETGTRNVVSLRRDVA